MPWKSKLELNRFAVLPASLLAVLLKMCQCRTFLVHTSVVISRSFYLEICVTTLKA